VSCPAGVAERDIRESEPSDFPAIEALYPRAFPGEDLLALVKELLEDRANTISLVATSDSTVVGNIIFTRGSVDGENAELALLAPLAVAPECQRQGIGSALVGSSLRRLRAEGIAAVYVLGDPAYYGRLGFRPERSVSPPYPLPTEWADAWQSQALGKGAAPSGGTLRLPDCWLDPALWSP
jgi:putative acetyltransferase